MKENKDPDKLKIASFRTKEGVWAEFCQKAESVGLTATDVIKAAMTEFIEGSYFPLQRTNTQSANVLTRDDVIDIVNTAIDTAAIRDNSRIDTLVKEAIDSNKPVGISIESVHSEIDARLEPLSELLTEIEELVKSQVQALRGEVSELKKPLARA